MKKVAYSDMKDWGMPPAHFDMRSARFQGEAETGLKSFWCGLSHYEPGGGVEWSGEDSPNEKVYVALEGELTVKGKDEEFVLGPRDSLYLGPNEGRSVKNNGKETATMVVIVNVIK
jgi:mannose-6-phosphate isomerase-like protein (cupin superfamily)